MMVFEIRLNPVTKKNHGRIVMRKNGSRFMLPSEPFMRYQKECQFFMPRVAVPIDTAVNVQAVYYMKTKRTVDLNNLHNALHDALVHYGILLDDRAFPKGIIVSTDGSYVSYDKENPRTVVTITAARGFEDVG